MYKDKTKSKTFGKQNLVEVINIIIFDTVDMKQSSTHGLCKLTL